MRKVLIALVVLAVNLPAFAIDTGIDSDHPNLQGRMEPNLEKRLSQFGPDDTIRVIIFFKDKADISVLKALPTIQAKTAYLRSVAGVSQMPLLIDISKASPPYRISNIERFYSTNTIWATVDKKAARFIAEHPSVEHIYVFNTKQKGKLAKLEVKPEVSWFDKILSFFQSIWKQLRSLTTPFRVK